MTEKLKRSRSRRKRARFYTLQSGIGFDLDDLAANASGILSERQREALEDKRKVWLFCFVIPSVVFGVWAVNNIQHLANDFTLRVYLILGPFALFIMYRTFAKWHRYTQALLLPPERVEGQVYIHSESSRWGTYHHLRVNDMEFDVDEKVSLSFKDGDPYRIYYASAANVILSVEPLRGR